MYYQECVRNRKYRSTGVLPLCGIKFEFQTRTHKTDFLPLLYSACFEFYNESYAKKKGIVCTRFLNIFIFIYLF